MHAITTPPAISWSAQFLYVLARFGLGLDGLTGLAIQADEVGASSTDIQRRE